MAVPGDFVFLDHLVARGHIAGRVLELGSYNRQGFDLGNAKVTLERRGLAWQGADIEAGPGVDLVFDILDPLQVDAIVDRWDSVLVMNLLEHVYDPIRALEAALSLVASKGTLTVAGPTVWQLHDFPADYWRPMPDFFTEFARRHECSLADGGLQWIVRDQLVPVAQLTRFGQKLLPSTATAEAIWGRGKVLRSRALNRLGRTSGRDMAFPYVGLGACLKRD